MAAGNYLVEATIMEDGKPVKGMLALFIDEYASRRALYIMEEKKLLIGGELKGASKVLKAAALTYVASLLSSILQLFRLILLTQGNNRRRR